MIRVFQLRRMRARGERGAVAVIVALLFSTVLVGIGAVTLDLGQQRVARRDMQSLADLVALDMGRLLDGKQGWQQLQSSTTWTTNLTNSVARNGSTFGAKPTVTATLGHRDDAGVFTAFTTQANPATTIPDAVQITARTNVRFSFGLGSSGGASASAIGSADQVACLALGSYAARINTSASNSKLFTKLLNGALGNINVDAASYTALAGANVGVKALAAALSLASPDQLATASLTEGQLLAATATVLTSQGNSAGAAAVNTIIAQLNSSSTGSTVLSQTVNLANVVGATAGVGQGSAVSGTVNALNLIGGSAFLINGSNVLSIPGLSTDLMLTNTGLVQTTKIGQGVEQNCGHLHDLKPAQVSTSQVDVSVTGQLASVATPAAISGLSVSATAGSTKIAVNLAKATGTLTNVVCGDATMANPTGLDMAVNSALTNVSLNQSFNISGTISTASILGNLLGSLLGTIVSVDVTGTVSYSAVSKQPSTSKTVQLRVPISPPDFASTVSTGSGDLGLALNPTATTTLTLTAHGVLGGIINLTAAQQLQLNGAISDAITSGLVNPLITSVNSTLVTPLQNLLGLQVGGADAGFGTLNGPIPVNCTATRLAG